MNLSNVCTCHSWVPMSVFLESTNLDSIWMKLGCVMCSEKPPSKFEMLMGNKAGRLELDQQSS